MEAHQAWYKDGATVVALVALLVSVVSSLISMRHTTLQDQQTAHLDLRSVLQRLLSVSKENTEMVEKYKGDEGKISFMNVLARQEMNVLASQGAKSARQLGPKLVASPEYLTIARAQAEAGNFEAQGEFIRLACSTAKTPVDRLGALRDSATYHFAMGRFAEGRAEFETQMGILKNLQHYAPAFLASANVELQLAWATLEANASGDMAAAQSHIQTAQRIATEVGPGPVQNALVHQINVALSGPPQGAPGAGAA